MEKLEMAAEVCLKRLLEYYPPRDEREKKGQKFFLNFWVFFCFLPIPLMRDDTQQKTRTTNYAVLSLGSYTGVYCIAPSQKSFLVAFCRAKF